MLWTRPRSYRCFSASSLSLQLGCFSRLYVHRMGKQNRIFFPFLAATSKSSFLFDSARSLELCLCSLVVSSHRSSSNSRFPTHCILLCVKNWQWGNGTGSLPRKMKNLSQCVQMTALLVFLSSPSDWLIIPYLVSSSLSFSPFPSFFCFSSAAVGIDGTPGLESASISPGGNSYTAAAWTDGGYFYMFGTSRKKDGEKEERGALFLM